MENEVLTITVPLAKYEALVECAANVEALARMFAASKYVNDEEVKAVLGIRIETFDDDEEEDENV